jgi:hypothetical protein
MLDGLQAALRHLTDERSRIDSAISSIENLLSNGTGSKLGRPSGRKRGRPAKASAARRTRNSKRAPRGLLKAKIHQALRASKKPLAPVELRNQVVRLGYPAKNLKSLYTSIFVAAKGDKAIQKSAKGFSLK